MVQPIVAALGKRQAAACKSRLDLSHYCSLECIGSYGLFRNSLPTEIR